MPKRAAPKPLAVCPDTYLDAFDQAFDEASEAALGSTRIPSWAAEVGSARGHRAGLGAQFEVLAVASSSGALHESVELLATLTAFLSSLRVCAVCRTPRYG